MTTKLSVSIVTLSMIATGLLGVALAQAPTNSGDDIGPNVNNNCAIPQAYGHSGNALGSGDGDYHRYINDQQGILLDACFNAAGIQPFAGCASSAAVSDVSTGAGTIVGSGGDIPTIFQGVGQATQGAGSAYQTPCGGLGGTGTDGEFEYGSAAAALNVREGLGTEPSALGYGGAANAGDGTDGCLGASSTAHHASDTTVFVADAVLGGAVGFTVSADWARPAGLSASGIDENTAPDQSHCGDGAIEPCQDDAHPGIENQLTTYGGAAGVVADAGHIVATATTSNLNHALDVLFGCNPLDATAHKDGVAGPVNAFNLPGNTLADFGNGGASGWLTVVLDQGQGGGACVGVINNCPDAWACVGVENYCRSGKAEVCIGVINECEGNICVGVTNNCGPRLSKFSVPTAGWIWTGSGASIVDPGDHP